MKKTGLIISLVGVIVVVVTAIVAIIFGGTDLAGLNYVKISVNPIIEFVCDGDKVISLNPMNEEAKELCAQEIFVNNNIEEACTKFVDLCARAGYIDVEKNDNAIKIDCISGLSHTLEVKVYNSIQNYLKENQILGMVLENDNDNSASKEAKKEKITVDKMTLIDSLTKLDESKTFNECKKYNEKTLIRLINAELKKRGDPGQTYSEENLTNKRVLIDLNRVKFATHLDSITEESKSKFKELYSDNQTALKKNMQDDFNRAYDTWRTNHINFVS